jgi:hypothetical protein
MLHYRFVMDMSVQNGELVLPSGMTYRVLVLPDTDRMRPELLAKVVELAKAGAKVFAPRKITASPSLRDAAASDGQVQALAASLPAAVKLEELLPAKDFETATHEPVVQLHRRAAGVDFYYVSNQSPRDISFDAAFRAGGQPEIWHTADMRVERAAAAAMSDGRMRVTLDLEPAESVFVVFRAQSNAKPAARFAAGDELPFAGEWKLQFPAGSGAPESVQLPKLISWPAHDNPEVQHFSGTATYTTHFEVPSERLGDQEVATLDLGDVQVMAEVKLNGKDLGLLWKPPCRVDVTDTIKPGDNTLEVSVTNLWPNRLIGDAAYPKLGKFKPTTRGSGIAEIPSWLLKGEPKPKTERKTFATWDFYKKDDPLLPSGLIGPVKLRFGRMVEIPAPK